jgi:hypothetical protein
MYAIDRQVSVHAVDDVAHDGNQRRGIGRRAQLKIRAAGYERAKHGRLNFATQ